MNRRPLWIDLRAIPVNKRLPYLAAARAAKAERIVVARDDPHATRDDLAAVTVDARHVLREGKATVGRIVTLRSAADQKRAAKASGIVVMAADDWRIIPLENLIAARGDRPGTLFARAESRAEAVLFADTLQVGAHGILLAPQSPGEIADVHAELLARPVRPRDAAAMKATPAPSSRRDTHGATAPPAPAPTRTKGSGPALAVQEATTGPRRSTATPLAEALQAAHVTAIEPAGTGERVCIDTTSMLANDEGMLVGGTAASLALVLAETSTSQFIAARPFRVNAGAVSNYVLAADGATLYLAEIASGSRLVAMRAEGTRRDVTVGRAKIETRPHILVRWTNAQGDGHVVLQAAETVALAAPGGTRIPVTALKLGDTILVAAAPPARHAGTAITADARER